MPRRTVRMPDGQSFSFDWDEKAQGPLTKRKVTELYTLSKKPKVTESPRVEDDRYWFNRPLTTAPATIGKSLAERETAKRYSDPNPNRFQAMLQGFGEGATEAAGDVLSQMTAPLDIAATVLGVKGARYGLNLLGRTLTGGRGLYNTIAGMNLDEPETNLSDLVTGNIRERSGPDFGQIGTGALELALSLAHPSAAKAVPKPTPKPKSSPLRGPLRTERLALPPKTNEPLNVLPSSGKRFTELGGVIDIEPIRVVEEAGRKGISVRDSGYVPFMDRPVYSGLGKLEPVVQEPINVTPPKPKKVKAKVTKKDVAATEKALGEFRRNVQTFIDTARTSGMPENRITEIVKKRFPSFLKDESGIINFWGGQRKKPLGETLPEFTAVGDEATFNASRKESGLPDYVENREASLEFQSPKYLGNRQLQRMRSSADKFREDASKLRDISPLDIVRNEKGSIGKESPEIIKARREVAIAEKEFHIISKRMDKEPSNMEHKFQFDRANNILSNARVKLRNLVGDESGSTRIFSDLAQGAKKVKDRLLTDPFTEKWAKPALNTNIPEIQEAVAQVISTRKSHPKPTEPTKLRSRSFKEDVYNPLATSGLKELEGMGEAGVQASRLMQRTRAEGAYEGGDRIARLKERIEFDLKLSKQEQANLADVAEGNALPINERVKAAFKDYRAIMDETLKAAKEVGLKLRLPTGERIPFEGREDYWAHVFPLDMFKGKARESMFNELIRKGKTPKEARQIIDNAEEFGGRLIDPQHARTLDLPGYRKDIQSQYTYLEDMWRRITEAKLLGPDDEVVNALTSKTSNPDYAHQVIGRQLGRIKSNHPAMEHYVNLANTAEVALKLPFFAISNMSQITAPLLKASVGDFGKALKSTIFSHKDAKLRAEATGALQAVYKMLYRDVAGEGKISKAYLMRPSEEINRTIASETGRFAVESEFAKLKKNPKDAQARKRLEDLLVEDIDAVLKQDSLTDKQKSIAGFRMSELTQGLTESMDLPRAWSGHPLFKFPQLFRRYAFQQSKIIKNAILENPKRNIPLILGLYSVMGEGIGDIKAGANAALQGEDIEEKITNRGEQSFIKEIMSEITDDESLQFWAGRLADNLSNAFAFGLVGDALDSAFSGKPSGFVELITGVFPGDVSKVAGSIGRSIKQRDIKPFVKTTLETSPFGRGISKRIYPD